MTHPHPQCGLNCVPSQRALPQRQKEEEEEEGGDEALWRCLFVVFTAKPLRTYRHFHQHSAVHISFLGSLSY